MNEHFLKKYVKFPVLRNRNSQKDLDETDSNSIWPSPPSLAEIELNPKQNANSEQLQTIDSSPGSPMDTSTPLNSDTEAAEHPVVVTGTSSKDTGADLYQASTMLA